MRHWMAPEGIDRAVIKHNPCLGSGQELAGATNTLQML